MCSCILKVSETAIVSYSGVPILTISMSSRSSSPHFNTSDGSSSISSSLTVFLSAPCNITSLLLVTYSLVLPNLVDPVPNPVILARPVHGSLNTCSSIIHRSINMSGIKHIPQPLRSHTQSFRNLGLLLKIPPFVQSEIERGDKKRNNFISCAGSATGQRTHSALTKGMMLTML